MNPYSHHDQGNESHVPSYIQWARDEAIARGDVVTAAEKAIRLKEVQSGLKRLDSSDLRGMGIMHSSDRLLADSHLAGLHWGDFEHNPTFNALIAKATGDWPSSGMPKYGTGAYHALMSAYARVVAERVGSYTVVDGDPSAKWYDGGSYVVIHGEQLDPLVGPISPEVVEKLTESGYTPAVAPELQVPEQRTPQHVGMTGVRPLVHVD